MIDGPNDDPVQRLVAAIVGSNDAHVTALANRVLGSQIGGTSGGSGTSGISISNSDVRNTNSQYGSTSSSVVNGRNNKHADLSSTWRRISRKGPDPTAKEDVERLYRLYERESRDPDIPPKLLAGE